VTKVLEEVTKVLKANTGTNQGPAYYQECVSLFGKKVFMKPVNE